MSYVPSSLLRKENSKSHAPIIKLLKLEI